MYQRQIKNRILDALKDTPVVLINGARQTGKSTLVEDIAKNQYPATYYTLDNLNTLSAIKTDPGNFINQLGEAVILDEIQKAPEIFSSIKETVDKNRKPGRFLLTGSANILLLPQLSESLAGRMEIITLWPLSQGEINDTPETFIDYLFHKNFSIKSPKQIMRRDELFEQILLGGYPEVLSRNTAARRHAWFQSYLTTLLQRDIRDIASIEGLTLLPRLLSFMATRSSTLLNYAEISRASGIPHTTLMRYLTLLQMIFLIHIVPPWSSNLSKRLVKTPKIYMNDTGLLADLLGIDNDRLEQDGNLTGMLLENFVVNELKKQATWNQTPVQFYHYRTQTGQEVDILLENAAGECVGIEVKASSSISEKDFKGLQSLSESLNQKFLRGIVLYTGDQTLPFGKNLFAMPVNTLWQARD